MKKVVIFLFGSLLAASSCTLDAWKIVVGPVTGIELELENGVDFIVPLIGFGQ